MVGQTQTGTQYRYRYKIATYYKWSYYTTEEPVVDEQREYTNTTVYSYARRNNYIVNVYNHLGLIDTILVEEGKSIDFDSYKQFEGFEFEGVYQDDSYVTEWDETSEVTESLNLYIKESSCIYTVTFVDMEGTEISTQEVESFGSAVPPTMEEVDGYIFCGWDTDNYRNVTNDMVVVPKYIAENEYATVALDNDAIKLYAGKSMGLTALITPAVKSDTELTWTSSDESVAVVSSEGEVTAIGKGTATITVTVNETGETAKCVVTVKVDSDTNLDLLKTSDLNVDEYGYLRGVKAGNNTVKEICEEFSNASIICKDADGKELSETDLVGTGAFICLVSGEKVIDQIEVVVTGDISGDGEIGNKDVSMLARTLLDKQVPTDAQILAGDVNGDGEVGNRDVTMISRSMLGKGTI